MGFSQEGNIVIQQDEEITKLLEVYKDYNSTTEFYQIQLGFGSYQRAQRLKAEVEADFPELRPKIEFESPSYRVRGGKFRTKIQAERKFIEVRKKYAEALILIPKK